MNNSIFNDYLNEYQSIGIGSLIYSLVDNIVSGVIRYYPPSVYSPNGIWDDDAITGICNDFIIVKLLNKGWLDFYFFSLDSLEGLKRVLKRDFRHYLISQKTRTEKTNLYLRIKRILTNDPKFQVLGEPNAIGSLWGLTSWLPTKEVILDPHDVMTIIEAIQLPPLIRYRSDSLKISPLISNYELSRLLEEIFLTLVKMIPLGVMFDAICNRLGVLTIDEILSLDETIGDENDQTLADVIPSSDIYIEAEVSSKQIAEDIYERLSDRQREILAAQFETGNLTLIEIGERIGVSKSTVSNELVNIGRIIRENQTDLSDIDHVIFLLKAFFIEDQINHKSNQNS